MFASTGAVHKKGLTLNAKRVVDTLLLLLHGRVTARSTPTGTTARRSSVERAAAWGAEFAMASSPKSAKLPASEVAARFESLPEFVAPDA